MGLHKVKVVSCVIKPPERLKENIRNKIFDKVIEKKVLSLCLMLNLIGLNRINIMSENDMNSLFDCNAKLNRTEQRRCKK